MTKKIKSTNQRLRLSVFRSNKLIYAQIINDQKGITLVAVGEKELSKKVKGTKTERAVFLGELLAKKAAKKKIKMIVFDRGKAAYHGRVKALADGARKGGLEF